MQALVGTIVFVIVCIIALFVTLTKSDNAKGVPLFIRIPAYFAGTVVACYVGMAIFGGMIWVIAWIGIILRECLQWLIVALLYPWHWIF